jgi:hypothetical protein
MTIAVKKIKRKPLSIQGHQQKEEEEQAPMPICSGKRKRRQQQEGDTAASSVGFTKTSRFRTAYFTYTMPMEEEGAPKAVDIETKPLASSSSGLENLLSPKKEGPMRMTPDFSGHSTQDIRVATRLQDGPEPAGVVVRRLFELLKTKPQLTTAEVNSILLEVAGKTWMENLCLQHNLRIEDLREAMPRPSELLGEAQASEVIQQKADGSLCFVEQKEQKLLLFQILISQIQEQREQLKQEVRARLESLASRIRSEGRIRLLPGHTTLTQVHLPVLHFLLTQCAALKLPAAPTTTAFITTRVVLTRAPEALPLLA